MIQNGKFIIKMGLRIQNCGEKRVKLSYDKNSELWKAIDFNENSQQSPTEGVVLKVSDLKQTSSFIADYSEADKVRN